MSPLPLPLGRRPHRVPRPASPLPWLLAGLLTAAPAAATPLSAASAKFDLRYDRIEGRAKERLQGAVRLGVRLDLAGVADVALDASTGETYASRWSTLHDFTGGDAGSFPIFVRRLYLERRLGPARLQLGAIPPIKNIASSTGIDPDGWIDGARFDLEIGDSVVELVAGSLSDLETPNVFSRDHALDYFELELTQRLSRILLVEASGEWLGAGRFLRGEARFDLAPLVGRGLHASAEGVYDPRRHTGLAGATVGGEPLADLGEAWRRALSLRVFYAYIDEDVGLRGAIADDFVQFGHALSLFGDGRITRDGAMGWFARYVVSETPRVTVGLKVSTKR